MNPKPELKEAKYGRCPVCGMALWPNGTCTLPLHTAKNEEPARKGKVKVEG